MSTYCYTSESGVTIEEEYPRGEAPSRLVVYAREGSETYYRDYRAEHAGGMSFVKNSETPRRGWPMTCFASGVNAEQGPELRKHLKDHGCPTEVSKDGDPIYTSAAHRKKALKIRGLYDKASYG